jgi:hypothetical protein
MARKLLDDSIQVCVRHDRLEWVAENWITLQDSPIYIGETGTLFDGHHRCTVAVITGWSLWIDIRVHPYSIELLPRISGRRIVRVKEQD